MRSTIFLQFTVDAQRTSIMLGSVID